MICAAPHRGFFRRRAGIRPGTVPKARSPQIIPLHAALDNGFGVAAEYLVHSIPTPAGILIADDYLVVEVAFFGKGESQIEYRSRQFCSVRINNREKSSIAPDSPGTVAASIKYPRLDRQKPGVTPQCQRRSRQRGRSLRTCHRHRVFQAIPRGTAASQPCPARPIRMYRRNRFRRRSKNASKPRRSMKAITRHRPAD